MTIDNTRSEMERSMDLGNRDITDRTSPRGGPLEPCFEADEWARLTVEQRLKRCQLMAEEAQEHAKTAPTRLAGSYLKIAEEWLQLAAEMQKTSSGRSP